eukprot:g734.t1
MQSHHQRLLPEDVRESFYISKTYENAADLDVTLTTQLSADRLWLLEGLCKRWSARIVAAVYMNQNISSSFVDEQIARLKFDYQHRLTLLIRRRERRGAGLTTTETVLDNAYPVNTMRNAAIDAVETTHFFMVDVDMWPSDGLHGNLVAALRALRYGEEGIVNVAVVVPPFSFYKKYTKKAGARLYVRSIEKGRAFDEIVPQTSRGLSDCFEVSSRMRRKSSSKRCGVFDRLNKGGHSSTDIEQWWLQEPGELRKIPCINSERYEPYVAIPKTPSLRYSDAFRGYGKNKVEFVQRLWLSNYTFYVVGGGFLFHHPHLVSEAMREWRNGGNIKASEMKRRNDDIFDRIVVQSAATRRNGKAAASLATPCCPRMLLSRYSNDLPPWCS